MHTISTCSLLVLVVCLSHVSCTNVSESCMKLYENGVEAYLENRFEDCVVNFEAAVDKYRIYFKKTQNCRMKCHNEAALADPLYPLDIENLYFYEKTVKNTLCILNCKDNDSETFQEFNLNKETVKLFEDRKPYEYLHACYYKTNAPTKAASAAFTYLVANPNDESMLKVLKSYATLPVVDMADVVNFEAKEYVYLYVHGTQAYEDKDWMSVIENMEESLASYLQIEDECRADCEGPFNQGWYPDLIPAIANHFTYCLRCKRKCKEDLSTLNGEKHDDLYPSHYHYLQYAYFKSGNLKAACQAVASYLLFYPLDEVMLYNKDYYGKLPKVQDDYLMARPEAIHYKHRDAYEEKLLKYIFKHFTDKPEITKQVIAFHNPQENSKRFILDKLITENECSLLVETAKTYSLAGDGYTGTISPHTNNENYIGLSLTRATMLVNLNVMDSNVLKLILKASDQIKQNVQTLFKIKKRLYYTYTHLVCRSAIAGLQGNRSDFSHPVHADNCNIQTDGTCPKREPAFTWRHYTAILYLNDDFSGGDFFFSADYYGHVVESTVQPLCGRLVAFTSGGENKHGVNAIVNGSRCALAIWFTFDEQHQENDRILLNNYYKT